MIENTQSLNCGSIIHGFKVTQVFDIDEYRLTVVQMHHEKSGANLIHLLRDDPNCTFSVQFRTTPMDNSGIPHILEHTVLCGSEKYPVRDPFFKMLRRSQATYMNAHTGSDLTMYPLSTMNSVDFQNLVGVYADAVFFPSLNKLDFMQEGWRLEPENLEDKSSKLVIKGIVYNEMKGVFSNSLNLLHQVVENNLLPVSYGYISGGHPDAIPSLSWEALKKFYHDFYHPSNANIYSYGNIDLDNYLQHLDSECLGKFTAQDPSPTVVLEPKWTESRLVRLTCQPDPTLADPSRAGVVSLSFALTDILEIYTNFALSIVLKLLTDGDSAPLYRGLIESGLGLDWSNPVHGMDRYLRTTCFHVGLQGVRLEDVEKIDKTIMDILKETAKTGFPQERVEAVLHKKEIAIREDSADFGLQLILAISSVVNHGGDLFARLSVKQLINRFKADLATDPAFLQKLISQYLVGNPHRLTVIMLPDDKFEALEASKEAERVAKAVGKLTEEGKREVVKLSRELAAEQKREEDLSCLPCLTLVDIPPKCRPEPFTETQMGGSPLQLNVAPTNGLVYFHALANISDLPQELFIYVPVFASLFSKLGADGLTYQEMDHLQELNTGALRATPHATSGLAEDLKAPCARHLHLSAYCLEEKVPRMFELLCKRVRANDWLDSLRIQTLVNMLVAGDWSANSLSYNAHRLAMRRASANLCSTGRMSELWSGIEQAAFMRRLAKQITNPNEVERSRAFDDFIGKMKAIADHALKSKRLRFSLHGEESGLASACKCLESFIAEVPNSEVGSGDVIGAPTPDPSDVTQNVYVALPYSVHYTSLSLPAPHYTAKEFPAYRVLSHLLDSKFLHPAIREQGGAYGGGSKVSPGCFAFYSYR
uniref:Presequence protease, mitochondrial n=2 Tax=Mesocestoides corti TaxID=53468 RepID=A0A5K3EFP7_MESCO